MALNIQNVHKLQRKTGSNEMVVVNVVPYKRFVSQGESPISVQGGRFWPDEGSVIALKDVPGWVRKEVDSLSPQTRKKLGLPPEGVDYSGVDGPPEREPASDDLQNLKIPSEPMSVVDATYSLDPTLDHHWTKTGLPNLSEIGKLRGLKDTTRAEVEEVTSGYRRPSQET